MTRLHATQHGFTLRGCGDYYEKDRYVGIKAGGDPAEYGNVTGPKGLAADPCAPIPDLPTIILFASGLVLVSVYFVYGGRRKGDREGRSSEHPSATLKNGTEFKRCMGNLFERFK